MENGGYENTFVLCVFGAPKRGRGAARCKRHLGGVVPLIDLNELNYLN